MRQWKKIRNTAVTAVLIAALGVGSALAGASYATRMLEAQFPGIHLTVNGWDTDLTDSKGAPAEPFVVDGTIYVPVRALGEALGKTVEWDPQTLTVSVGKVPLLEDAEQLVNTVERVHPAFALEDIPAGYEAAKHTLLELAADPDCTLYDFAWAAMAYTASLGDGHTSVDTFGGTPQTLLDVSWMAVEDKLFLTDETGKPTSTEVTAVGGLSTAELFSVVDRYIPSENQSGQNVNHSYWSAVYNLLAVAGVTSDADNRIPLTLREDGVETTRTVGPAAQAASAESAPIIAYEKIGDVFYVDFNQCVLGPEVDAAAEALARAVEDGTEKVILDVRGNGGGNSNACAQLLAAVGMEPPWYGGYVRYSPLAQEQREHEPAQGSERRAPNTSTAKQNPAVKLVVLTDEGTYSSATMLGVWVQDGKLGTVIGRASANAPNSYGDILFFTLKNTNVLGRVSYKQWLRPDTSADPHTLLPDVETALGEDILEAALEYLK